MPPRHAYWTILLEGQPTAFRAADVEELLPTFNRLREKHADTVMKWFERGRLWDSREAARQSSGRGTKEPRGRSWRPGGEHRDPREKYQLAKKAKWQRFKAKIRERHEGRTGDERRRTMEPPADERRERPIPSGPRGDRWRDKRSDWTARPQPASDRARTDRPRGAKPRGPKQGDRRPAPQAWPPDASGRPTGPKGDRRAWSERPKGERPRGPRGASGKTWSDRPPQDRPRGPKNRFGPKPHGPARGGPPRGPRKPPKPRGGR